jgi:prephenate dehydratase
METKIAIQGFEGCFHQVAAQHYFGKNTNILPCASFRELVKAAQQEKTCTAAVMAIENSIVGSILPNYSLLQQSHLEISGEIYLTIRQQLLVNPGVQLTDIREVHSHPMALQQCFGFLDNYPHWKLVETEDTALSARQLARHKARHTAAIASKLAADLFHLEVLAPNIHTQKKNYTRFLVLEKKGQGARIQSANKASVYFRVSHKKGSLARVLQKIADYDINLSKLQSFPVPGGEWAYYFHADLEFDVPDFFENAMEQIRPITENLQVLGRYKKGITI